ncbi:hypothetical protein Mapa_009169 [Marchantia paleacea]|nr:hypothetical protein Mapa_009169 [Marchantia paleacea]
MKSRSHARVGRPPHSRHVLLLSLHGVKLRMHVCSNGSRIWTSLTRVHTAEMDLIVPLAPWRLVAT